MADSTCLIHGFSYASAIPNESKQGNPMHVLGESVSFGRFMTESLSWEKWSTFSSHKKYVVEAQRYAQPGSVAQKKAFFEAHYKKIAAQKAAALLEQENAAKSTQAEAQEELSDDVNVCDQQIVVVLGSSFEVDAKPEVVKIENVRIEDDDAVSVVEIGSEEVNGVIIGDEALEHSPIKRNSISHSNIIDNHDSISASESSETPQIERPLLKNSVPKEEDAQSVTSKKRSSFSSLRSSIQRKTWKVPSTPINNPVTAHMMKENTATQNSRKASVDFTEKKRSSPKSLRALINLLPTKDPDKELVPSTKKTQGPGLLRGSLRMPSKDCPTPSRTPLMAGTKNSSKYAAATPQAESKRLQTPVNPSAPGSKTGPKRHIFSAIYNKSLSACRNKLQSPTLSTPFILRTEERAAKRKQKLEEKFNASEVQKVVQQQKTLKDKAGDELRKLGCGFCFKARPLPDFYKEREPPKNQLKKIQATPSQQPSVPGKSNLKKTTQSGTVSMPPPPPPPSISANKGASKILPKKVATSKPTAKSLITNSLGDRIAHENASPNILI